MVKFLSLLLIFFLFSCAEKVSTQEKQEQSYIYRLPSSDYKNHYMTCNLFTDKTFQGYIYDSPRENCVFLDIDKAPKALFEKDYFFLQMYPFKVTDSEIDYGASLRIYTLDKANNQTLVESFILDFHIVQLELEKEATLFFEEHRFEVCGLGQEWEGLQMVIYERRNQRDQDPVPIRVSKFLKPPFLIHPEYFRDSKGNELAAYHPFSSSISDVNSNPNQYYERAEEICSPYDNP